MKTKIIGTGLSGLIGSRIQELLSSDFEFIDFSLEKGIDILDFNLLKKEFSKNKEAEVVIHLAAFTDVNKAWQEREDKNGLCYRVNVLGTRNIVALCKKYKKYLIHISTDFVFDGKKPIEQLYTEKDQPIPLEDEWYGQTKCWAEEEVEKSGCQFVILRPAFPFKARPSQSEKKIDSGFKLDLVRKIIKNLQEGKEVRMFSDQIITPTFVDDFSKAIDQIVKRKPKGIYHVVGSTALSPYQIALKISEVFSFDKNKIKKSSLQDFGKDSRPRQQNLGLSNKKLEKDLGFKMYPFEEALRILKKQRVKF